MGRCCIFGSYRSVRMEKMLLDRIIVHGPRRKDLGDIECTPDALTAATFLFPSIPSKNAGELK